MGYIKWEREAGRLLFYLFGFPRICHGGVGTGTPARVYRYKVVSLLQIHDWCWSVAFLLSCASHLLAPLSLPSSFVSFFSHLIPRRLLTLFRESITSNQIQSEKNQVEEKYSILQGFNFDTFARLSAKTKRCGKRPWCVQLLLLCVFCTTRKRKWPAIGWRLQGRQAHAGGHSPPPRTNTQTLSHVHVNVKNKTSQE